MAVKNGRSISGVGPEIVLPRHVRACVHSTQELERWYIYTWKRGAPDVQCRVPYACNSWRCPVCRRHEAAVTFARIREAMEPLDPSGWCFFVLTLDRNAYLGGKRWTDVNEAYSELGRLCRATLGRIGRLWGPEVVLEKGGRSGELRIVRKLGNRWVGVVEAHRSGWPHLNLLVWCPELAELLRSEHADRLEDPEVADAVALARDAWKNGEPLPELVRERARRATLAGGRVLELLRESGWGHQSTAEAARSTEALAGYVVKLAGMHDAAVGEVAKITQVPMNAPERFRRLRSGKGFLPPRHKDPEVTGCMVRRRVSAEGDWEIVAVNAPADEAQKAAVERAIEAELQLIQEEEGIRSRNRGELVAMPPIRLVVKGKLLSHQDTSERLRALQTRELAAAG